MKTDPEATPPYDFYSPEFVKRIRRRDRIFLSVMWAAYFGALVFFVIVLGRIQ